MLSSCVKTNRSLQALIIAFLLLLLPVRVLSQRDLTRHVDPFIGTAGHGHTYPGASMPFGMVQLSPDTRLEGWDGCSGYHYSDSRIYGFSHTHLSGTGISDYGDILFMPVIGEVFTNNVDAVTVRDYTSSFSHSRESAEPGYYSVKLDNGVLAELTVTPRVGVHRYSFPAEAQTRNLVVDLIHRDHVLDSYLRVVDSKHLEGFRRSEGWARDQIVYFVAEFSQEFHSLGTARNDLFIENRRELRGTGIKGFFRFANNISRPLVVKVAISAVSIEGARRNLEAEGRADFDEIRVRAKQAWNAELNKIQVKGQNEAQLRTFYTALYHAMLAPNLFMDADGEYRGLDSKTHTAKGFDYYTVFSLWDTFRAAHPLYTILDQKRSVDFINTFLAQYQQGGRLPVWELAANETDCMIGYHAVSVIADAIAKDLKGFDRELALTAMKHSAELKHFGLGDYIGHGYIDVENERESVSRTLEYAYDDWCIAQTARLMGRVDDYNHYIRRAQSYKNVFDVRLGFMRPRGNAGWTSPFDPREVTFSFTEANSWQYTFFVPQDVSGLIKLLGGEEKFVRKLDDLFAAESKTTGREQADITGLMGQYAHGNEPSHHIAYLYNYANQPWQTQYRVRRIMDEFYKPQPDGLIGNEDCGQMSAWYVLSAAGFYPVTPGSPVYAFGSPIFPEVLFNLENGKSFVIKARGVSPSNLYIQSAKLNGKPYQKSFITHADLMSGGELVFEMGPRPNRKWGVGPANVPVAQIADEKTVPVPLVNAFSKTFKERTQITLEAPNTDLRLYYTTDGSEPDLNARVFTAPFFIDRSTTIKAKAFDSRGLGSLVATANFYKLPHDWNIKLDGKYSLQYTAGGDLGLIDGVRGNKNVTGGAWQGYQSQDLVATVDFGEVREVSKMGAGFLQDVHSWIFMPPTVDFELSLDGHDFIKVLSLKSEVADDDYNVIIKDIAGTIQTRKARYLRIRAHNYGKLPRWHAGSGGDAWIFVDEIIVE